MYLQLAILCYWPRTAAYSLIACDPHASWAIDELMDDCVRLCSLSQRLACVFAHVYSQSTIVTSASRAYSHISWSKCCLFVCVCSKNRNRCTQRLAHTDLLMNDPLRTLKYRSVWPNLRVKIARQIKWAWIGYALYASGWSLTAHGMLVYLMFNPFTADPQLRLYSLPYWSNPPFLISDIRALWRSVLSARAPECQKLKMVG